MTGKIGPGVPQSVINAVIAKVMIDEAYDSYWAGRLEAYQYCDMTPVVYSAEAYAAPNRWGDSWAVEVQYSSRGGRAVYGVNRDHVPHCYAN